MDAAEVIAALGARFEAHALHVGAQLDVRAFEPRLTADLPVVVELLPWGCAVLLRGGAVVMFGGEPASRDAFVGALGDRLRDPHARIERERATIRVGEADAVEPDALVLSEVTIEALQVIAEILGKSVILARHEQDLAEVFTAIEPFAAQMVRAPKRRPWTQQAMVRHIGAAMLAQHQLVGTGELLEKPELLWERPRLDRLYARLEEEYELRERHTALDRKLAVVSQSAQTMLDLQQARRSLHVEYYIVALIVFEVVMGLFDLATK